MTIFKINSRPLHADSVLLTRFAPSPTGLLHLGHVISALMVWGVAKKLGAKVLLRLEDHDRQRSSMYFAQEILKDLEWLGFRWHGEPTMQSRQTERYHEAFAKLKQQGFAFACECSRSDILRNYGGEKKEELWYSGTCRRKQLAWAGLGWRCMLEEKSIAFADLFCGQVEQVPASQCGDVLVRDRHGNWTYQFCVVVDDILDDIDFVIRGMDLLSSTGRQLQLQQILGHGKKISYGHHPLILGTDGQKLSKKDAAMSVQDMRRQGKSPEQVLTRAAFKVGLVEGSGARPFEQLIEGLIING